MRTDDARALLDDVPALERPCDLDLLLFFARHPRTLISTEQLVRLLGYPLSEIGRSRDVLLAAGFLTRTQNTTQRPPLYEFVPDGADGRSLSAVVELASTRNGRLTLRRALAVARAGGTDVPAARSEDRPPEVPGSQRAPGHGDDPGNEADKQLRRQR
jgi:hypothetical protein